MTSNNTGPSFSYLQVNCDSFGTDIEMYICLYAAVSPNVSKLHSFSSINNITRYVLWYVIYVDERYYYLHELEYNFFISSGATIVM